MNRFFLKILVAMAMAASVIGLYSCGSGDTQVANGGIGGTGITQGRVTGFGSVFVNGIEFNTDNASFTVKHLAATQNDLAIGMVVRIRGSSDSATATGTANSITYDSLVEGLVNSNDIALNNTLRVMQQTINVDGDTVYNNPIDATLLENLPPNSVVEVSGFTDGNGAVLATRIEVKSLAWAGAILKVSGVINRLSGTTYQIGSILIDASSIQTVPPEGTFVDVKGYGFSGNLFIAQSIEKEDEGNGVVGDDGEEVEIEGRIFQSLDANDHFTLNGQVVDASATSLSGATSQLTIGRMAEVEGVMNGVILLAEEIELKATSSQRGEISGVLGVGNVDISAGTVTLLGRTIRVDNSTMKVDDSSFDLEELIFSDYLEASVYYDNGTLVASKLELDQPPSNHTATVEGIPDFVNSSTIEIFGVTIDISRVDDYSFSSQFIEVQGNFVNGVLIADRIEEDD